MRSIACFYVYVPSLRAYADVFAESYRSHRSGVEHELVVLVKSDTIPTSLPNIPAVAWDAVGEDGWDIGPFLRMARHYRDYDRVVLLGSYSRILCDGWLQKLVAAGPIASATGSWEVNPHLRTNCISLHPSLLDSFDDVYSHEDCWAFEHGPDNVYQRHLRVGIQGVVVGRDGVSYVEQEWRESRTYRSGEQNNLLCADNRTDDYAHGGLEHRDVLERLAWTR